MGRFSDLVTESEQQLQRRPSTAGAFPEKPRTRFSDLLEESEQSLATSTPARSDVHSLPRPGERLGDSGVTAGAPRPVPSPAFPSPRRPFAAQPSSTAVPTPEAPLGPGLLKRTGASLMRGAGAAEGAVGGMAQFVGQTVLAPRFPIGMAQAPPEVQTSIQKSIIDAGKDIAQHGEDLAKRWTPPDYVTKSILEDPSQLASATWWADNFPAVLPSMAAFLIPVYAGAFFGGAAGAVLTPMIANGLFIAGSVYHDAIKAGQSPREAAQRAAAAFAVDAPLTALQAGATAKLVKSGAGKIVKALAGTGLESGQEMGEQVIQNVATDKPAGEGVAEAGVLASASGPVVAPVFETALRRGEGRGAILEQQKALAEAKAASGLMPPPPPPVTETRRGSGARMGDAEASSQDILYREARKKRIASEQEAERRIHEAQARIQEAHAREAEARARKAEAEEKLVVSQISQAEVETREGQGDPAAVPAAPESTPTKPTAPKGRFQTFLEDRGVSWDDYGANPNIPAHQDLLAEFQGRRPAARMPAKTTGTAPGPTRDETRPGTETEEEVPQGPRQPLPEDQEAIPDVSPSDDLAAEQDRLQERARDIRRRIKAGQQGYVAPKAEAVGETPASYLSAAGGVKFDRSMQGELQDLPRPARKFVSRTGASADVLVDRMRTDHPEWGIETESDLIRLLREGGDRLHKAGGDYGMEEATRQQAQRDGNELDLMGPRELKAELARTQEQIGGLRDHIRGLKMAGTIRVEQEYNPKGRKIAPTTHVKWDRLQELGTTDDFREAGFLRPDGKLINLSGGEPGKRVLDHRIAGGDKGRDELVANGYIRLGAGSSLEIRKEPTAEQYEVIKKWIDYHTNIRRIGVVVDLEDGLGELNTEKGHYRESDRVWRNQYNHGASEDRIINNIKTFFSGELPKRSWMTDFHYNPRVGEDVLVGGQRRTVTSVDPFHAAVFDPETGEASTVKRSTTRRIPTEPRPRVTGPDAILERIVQRVRQERLDPEVGDAARAFVVSLSDTGYLDDLAISIRKGQEGGPQGRYTADVEATGERSNAVISIFHNAATDPRVGIHEIVHHLEQFVPDEDLVPLRTLYKKEKAAYIGRLAQGKRGEFTPEARYRYSRDFGEYFAERLADLELARQKGNLDLEQASAWMKPALAMKHLLQTWWDAVRDYFKSDVAARIYKNLQLGKYGIEERQAGLPAPQAWQAGKARGATVGRYEAGAIHAEPFYSQLRRTVEQKMGGRQDAASLKAMLYRDTGKVDKEGKPIIQTPPGVKLEELEDTGILEWLDGQQGSVKKADVLKYLDDNTAKVEVVKHDKSRENKIRFRITKDGKSEIVLAYPYEFWDGEIIKPYEEGGYVVEVLDPIPKEIETPKSLRYPPDQYGDYWLPGGQNHQEMLLTLPPRDTFTLEKHPDHWRIIGLNGKIMGRLSGRLSREEVADYARTQFKDTGSFRSSHFPDKPNILAHLRLTDHVGPNGERVLLVDEAQSDWHREGKKKGYRGTPEPAKLEPGFRIGRMSEFEPEYAENIGAKPNDWIVIDDTGEPVADLAYPGDWDQQKVIEAYQFDADEIGVEPPGVNAPSVPDAPWKKTWHERAMKEVIRYAAEHGYDRIAWVTGEQTADRYDLSKHINRAKIEKRDDGWAVTVWDKDDRVMPVGGANTITGIEDERLPDYVGKDLADRSIKEGGGTYSGLDLKVGGEWARALYDHAISRFMAENAKKGKWGSSPEDVFLKEVADNYKIIKNRLSGHETSTKEWIVTDKKLNKQADFATKSEAEEWIKRNSTPHSIALTPDAIDAVIYAGQSMYYDPKQITPARLSQEIESEPPPLGKEKERSLPKSLEKSGRFGGYARTYTVVSDKEALEEANRRIAASPDDAYADLMARDAWDKHDAVTAQRLFDHYRAEADRLTDEGHARGETDPDSGLLSQANRAFERQITLVDRSSKRATAGGQLTQSWSMVSKLSPMGVLRWAEKRIDEINAEAISAGKDPERGPLTPEEIKKLQEKAAEGEVWTALGDRAQEMARFFSKVFSGQPLTPDEWKRVKNLTRAIQVSAPKRKSKKMPDLDKLGYAERARTGQPQPPTPRPKQAPRPSVQARIEKWSAIRTDAGEKIKAWWTSQQKLGVTEQTPDPAILTEMVRFGTALMMEKGAQFEKWSKVMTADLGDFIRPHLPTIYGRSEKIYRQARDMERLADHALSRVREAEEDVDRPTPPTKVQALARAYDALRAQPEPGTTQDEAAEGVRQALADLAKKEKSPLTGLLAQAQREATARPRPAPEPAEGEITYEDEAAAQVRELTRKKPLTGKAKALARLMRRAETALSEADVTQPLTYDDAQALAEAVKRLQTMTGKAQQEYAEEVAQLIGMLKAPTLQGKAGAIYMTNMLSGTKTFVTRNPLGNEILYRLGRIGRFGLSPSLDWTVSKLRGTPRTTTFSINTQGFNWGKLLQGDVGGAFRDSYWEGMIEGFMRSARDLPAVQRQAGESQDKYETGVSPQFRGKGWIQKAVEAATGRKIETPINLPALYVKGVSVALNAPDNANWVRVRNATLGDMAKTAWVNAGKPADKKAFVRNYLANVTDETMSIAEQEAAYYTLKDPTILSAILTGAKRLMNLEPRMVSFINKKAGDRLRKMGWTGQIGLGSVELPFSQVPGSLTSKVIDFSPAGILRGMYTLTVGFEKGKNQREGVKALTNGITGNAGFTALGFWMATLGLIGMSPDDEDRDVRAVESEQTGEPRGPWINWDGIYRYVTSGFGRSQAERREGDRLYSIDWAQPAAVNLAMTIETMNRVREKGEASIKDLGQIAVEALSAGAETMVNLPLFQTLRRTLRPSRGKESALKPLIDALEGVPATFLAPSILNEIKQYIDNKGRITHDPQPWQRALNRALYRLPILSKRLPLAYKSMGIEFPKELYQDGRNTLWHVFFDPGFVSTYRESPDVRKLMRPHEEAGETRQFPDVPKPKETFSASALNSALNTTNFKKPVTLEMTGPEFSDWQRMNANLFTEKINAVDTTTLEKMTPEEQAKLLSDAKQNAKAWAREWFIQTYLPKRWQEKPIQDALNPKPTPKPRPGRPTSMIQRLGQAARTKAA